MRCASTRVAREVLQRFGTDQQKRANWGAARLPNLFFETAIEPFLPSDDGDAAESGDDDAGASVPLNDGSCSETK